MKIGGKKVTPNESILVLPRPDGDLIIKARSADINDEFDARFPLPIAPLIQTKDGNHYDYKDPDYKRACKIRDGRRFSFLVLRSLEPSNIEWDTVDMESPNTWSNWTEDMKNAGMSEVEVQRVINTVLAANALDEEKIQQALDSFLRGQGESLGSTSGPLTEHQNS